MVDWLSQQRGLAAEVTEMMSGIFLIGRQTHYGIRVE